ncbi:hypothetical protein T484DRAFT_1643092, partial [Baffinella frigidus]
LNPQPSTLKSHTPNPKPQTPRKQKLLAPPTPTGAGFPERPETADEFKETPNCKI